MLVILSLSLLDPDGRLLCPLPPTNIRSPLDKIVVLEEGKIAEEGRHADLLANGQTYARFFKRQLARTQNTLVDKAFEKDEL